MNIRMGAAVGASVTLVAALAAPATAALPAAQPAVIGGEGGASPAVVALDFAESYACSGSLWRARIIVTAAHCVQDDNGATYDPSTITLWAPGSNTTGPPADVAVTDIVVDTNWEVADSDYERVGRDVALLVLDKPLGTPYYARLATEMEAATLTWNSAAADFAGYGITTPSVDPRAELAAVPTTLSSTFVPSYQGGVDSFEVSGDGIRGTCGGDSGGPWMGDVAGTRVLVGPLSGGRGAPCDRPQPPDKTFDEGGVASANTDLTSVALRLAGEQPDAIPQTCIKGPDLKRTCWDGRAWEYQYCWDVKKAELWRNTGGDRWKRIERLTGWKDRDICGDPKTPYVITFRQITPTRSQWYSVKIPKQGSMKEPYWDDFRATVS